MKKALLPLQAILLTLTFSSFVSTAKAACEQPVDPKRMVIFVGMNEAFLERQAAEKAACLRGESFVSLPRSLPGEEAAIRAFKELIQLDAKLKDLVEEFSTENCQESENIGKLCKNLRTEIDTLTASRKTINETYQEYWARLKTATGPIEMAEEFRALMHDLAARQIETTAIILSGHSTGSGVWGLLGSVKFDKIQSAITDAYKENEPLLSKLGMILLWGCNTINPYTGANTWIRSIPNIKLIFGFQGSAPSSKNPASATLLHNILLSGPALKISLKKTNPEIAIKKQFDSIRGIGSTIGSAFINDDARSFYYERTHGLKDDEDTWVSVVKPAQNLTLCELMRPELQADQDLIKKIMNGEIEIPVNTSGGFLRDLYTRARRNEGCRTILEFPHNADQVGYLLFWHHLKKNTARYFGSKLAPTLEKLTSEEIKSQIEVAISEHKSRQIDHRKKRGDDHKKFSEIAHQITAEYQAYQEAADEMPWSKKHERRLKRLIKKVARMEKKAKTSEASELLSLRLKLKVQTELKEIAGPDFEQKLRKIYAGLENQREMNANNQRLHAVWMKTVEAQKLEAPASSEIQNKIQVMIQTLPPLTPEGITSMSRSELRIRHSAAIEKLHELQKIGSIFRSNKLTNALETVRDYLEGYRQLALDLKTDCMDFETWHEFNEDVNAPKLRSRCFEIDIRQILPLQLLPMGFEALE